MNLKTFSSSVLSRFFDVWNSKQGFGFPLLGNGNLKMVWISRHPILLALVFGQFSGVTQPVQAAAQKGVVVEAIHRNSVFHRAGVQKEDLFFGWQRLPNPPENPTGDRGKLRSYFHWKKVELEQAPRGQIVLLGERKGNPIKVPVPPGPWKISVMPYLNPASRQLFERGNQFVHQGRFEKGFELWEKVLPKDYYPIKVAQTWANSGNLQKAIQIYNSLFAAHRYGPIQQAVLYSDMGHFHRKNGASALGVKAYQNALAALSEDGEFPLFKAFLFNQLGGLGFLEKDLKMAGHYWHRALEIYRKQAPESGPSAICHSNLGLLARNTGELEKADRFLTKSIEIKEKLVPDSISLAISLNNYGNLMLDRGILDTAGSYYERSQKIFEKWAPGGSQLGTILINLGHVALKQQKWGKAEGYFQDAFAIKALRTGQKRELEGHFYHLGNTFRSAGEWNRAWDFLNQAYKLQREDHPHSLKVAATLSSLGFIARKRGHWEQAETYYRQAFDIRKALAPNSLALAGSLTNLGTVFLKRGQLKRAQFYGQRALDIYVKIAPESLAVATSLNNLGVVAFKRKEFSIAENYFLGALEIREKLTPGSEPLATTLNNLGVVAIERGNLNLAECYYRDALNAVADLPPGNFNQGLFLGNLGDLAMERGRWHEAEAFLSRSNYILGTLAPGSFDAANCQYFLGMVAQRQENPTLAVKWFTGAVDVLEIQSSLLGGSLETRFRFRGDQGRFYRGLYSQLIQETEFEKAFEFQERSRARTLLEIMAQRELDFAPETLPGKLLEARNTAGFQYQKTQEKLGKLTLGHPEVEGLRDQLFEIHRQYDAINAQIRESFPKLAPPKPLGLPQIKAALEPGTVLMSFCVLEKQTALFLVRKDAPLQVITIPEGRAFWDEKVSEILGGAFMDHSKLFFPDFLQQSGVLYQLLIAPAMPHLQSAQRLVVIPDGALKKLPFALLYDLQSQRYLIEKKPLSTVVSATVYAELKRRPNKPLRRMVALGDPLYPYQDSLSATTVDGSHESEQNRADGALIAPDHKNNFDFVVRSRMARHGPWPRLPQTANEVNQIATLFGEQAQTHLGREATEDVAKTLGQDVDVVHIAAHGFTDDHRALDSGLVLTLNEDFQEGEENGILHAWEIIESMRLDANLVVLSACQTALGKDAGGEGLIGLTHAFQFAGARSIVASFWNVNDVSTAVLMEKFYRYLKEGHNKATALQKAQIDLIRNPVKLKRQGGIGRWLPAKNFDASHPYHWAAFQLIGPWD